MKQSGDGLECQSVARRVLSVEYLDKDAGSRGGICFPHDVLNVFFDGLFGNLQRVRNFLICPAFC